MLSLCEIGRDLYQGPWEDKIKDGDVVLIQAPNKPRPMWQLGRVIELLPGKDKVTRCARIMRPDRTDGVYSINHLYPMELSVSPIIIEENEAVTEVPSKRPRRANALNLSNRAKI